MNSLIIDSFDSTYVNKQWSDHLRQLTVSFILRNSKGRRLGTYVFCECSCGNIQRFNMVTLKAGRVQGCEKCRRSRQGKKTSLALQGRANGSYKHGMMGKSRVFIIPFNVKPMWLC